MRRPFQKHTNFSVLSSSSAGVLAAFDGSADLVVAIRLRGTDSSGSDGK